MSGFISRIDQFLKKDLWILDLSKFNLIKTFFIKTLRLISFTIRELLNNELQLRAVSLVYTTLLSIVPLIAFSFSILQSFGVVNNQLEPLLIKFLAPLGEKGIQISQTILEFVGNMKVGVLGTVGLLTLLYTVFSMIKKIDDSINVIWKVHRGRGLVKRFTNYISLTIIGPMVMFAILGLTATLASNTVVDKLEQYKTFGTLILIWGTILPYLILSIVFTIIYLIVPNTKVNIRPAIIGGVIAGIFWQVSSILFAKGVASSTKYFAIYSSLAILILFMIWQYISWLIVLIGAQISYCSQKLDYSGINLKVADISSKLKERITLSVMYLIGNNYSKGLKNLSLEQIVENTNMPYDFVSHSITELKNKNLIIETTESPTTYLPARDLELISLKEIIYTARTNEQSEMFIDKTGKSLSDVDSILKNIDLSINESLENKSLKDLVNKPQ
ncbi:MAG: YhjD/YihY/BrkB family envelope integrity protein [Thermodesulfobacteriota bacterium]